MSSLKMHEKAIFEKLFNRGGYVLDFNDSAFAEFFREHGINIEANKYHINGRSKMKRLRAFWKIEPDSIVGQVLHYLLKYACNIGAVDSNDKNRAEKIISRLQGVRQNNENERDAFLKQEFKDISIDRLNLNNTLQEVTEIRIKEIEKCLKSNAPLATIFLCGSTLEGLLLAIAEKYTSQFRSVTISPKSQNGKILAFQNWRLKDFIDVAKELGFLQEDVKKFSHALRNFRNYIHPYQQVIQQFNPDNHTAKICFQVLKATIYQINKKVSNTNLA